MASEKLARNQRNGPVKKRRKLFLGKYVYKIAEAAAAGRRET
jgi:hypothetical protein